MILIADSGATKTDWRIIDTDGNIQQAKTIGLSPYYQTSESIAQELTQHLLPSVTGIVNEIYFYGTGCAGEEPCNIVRRGLQAVFSSAHTVEVDSDMLGAARGLCGHEAGIACILGTGSNNCLYDGQYIADKIPSLGFWLGDEGSGGYLGKKVVVAFLQKEMPEELAEKFARRYGLNREIVLENAYQKPFPNRYFASFSKFVFDNRTHPFTYQLAYDAFLEFLTKYVCKLPNYQQYKVHFVGSVAFYYNDILRRAAAEKGITIGHVMETPIAGLTLYHRPVED
ncbi:N-acetylglucosamine kinase [Runella zeae]|uniref:N-acetylglucosamine kinase n=1 Tax=Runella zeae TaxID=94255 RepID=UPI002354FECD|nr:N-acetylglucosamine kinase [Runella zeae]